MAHKAKPDAATSRYRFPPILLAVAVVILIIGIVMIVVNVARTAETPVSTAQTTPPLSSPSLSSSPPNQPASPSPSDTVHPCPKPVRLIGAGEEIAMKNRVLDFVEANLLPDAKKQVEAYRERGDPPGLLTKELQKRYEAEVADMEEGSAADMTVVLDRVQSIYDLDDEASDKNSRIVYVQPVFTTCRDGKIVNDPVGNPGAEPIESTWIEEDGAWRVTV